MGVPTDTVYVNPPVEDATDTEAAPATFAPTWPHGVKFCHIRNAVIESKRGLQVVDITASYRFADVEGQRVVQLGYSFCAPQDMFSHAIGRSIAYNRMINETFTVPLRSNRHSKPISTVVMDTVRYAIGVKSDLSGLPNSWVHLLGTVDTISEEVEQELVQLGLLRTR